MSRGFLRVGINTILDRLHKSKYMVSVPYIATMTEVELETFNEPTEFMDGVPLKDFYNKDSYSRGTNREESPNRLEPSVIDGKVIEDSVNDRVTVYISLALIIDHFNSGYTIRIVNNDDTMRITNLLSEILDEIELMIENERLKNLDEIFNYIDDFYQNMTNINRTVINTKMQGKNVTNVLGLGNGLNMSVKRKPKIDISKILVK